MIRQLASSFFRARLGAAHVTALLGLAGAMFLPAAGAVTPGFDPASVKPGDTFSIETDIYNTTNPAGFYNETDPTLDPTFGSTTTYPGAAAAAGGTFVPLTVSSTETTSGGVTTDSINISVTGNFVPTTTDNNGNLANAMEFSIGTYNGGTDTLDYTAKLVNAKVSGTVTYNVNGQVKTAVLTQTTMSINGGLSYSAEEAVQSFDPSVPLQNYDLTAFNLTVTYSAVPEPSTYATMALGAVALLWVTARRRAARA